MCYIQYPMFVLDTYMRHKYKQAFICCAVSNQQYKMSELNFTPAYLHTKSNFIQSPRRRYVHTQREKPTTTLHEGL